MAIDIAALVIVFVWAVFGYRKGFARQLFGLLAIVCVVLFSTPMAQIAEHVLADEADITMPGARMRVVLTSTPSSSSPFRSSASFSATRSSKASSPPKRPITSWA